MKDFLKDQFEQFWKNFQVILVSVLFLCAMGSALYIHTRGGMDEGTMDWARTVTMSLLSLLGGLLGGIKIGKGLGKEKDGPNPPAPPNP